jgi:hypothetical protein
VSPPVVRHAIDVAASPDDCWKVLANLGTWPNWFPRLKYASMLDGESDPWRVGGRFEMVFDFGVQVSVKPVVEEVERARPWYKVRWTGKGWGLTGVHAYTLESHAPGLTRVTSHEEFSGVGSRLLTGRLLERMDSEVHRSMERFKALVEHR